MKEFFQDDFGAAKDNYDDNQSWLSNQDFSRENKQVNGVREAEPWTVQVGVSGRGGVGGGGAFGSGFVLSCSEDKEVQVGRYTTYGGGGHAGVNATFNLDVTLSDNDYIFDLEGKAGAVGGSFETNIPIFPSLGYEVNINSNVKPSHTLSVGKGVSSTFIESHGYITNTEIIPLEFDFLNNLNKLLEKK